jgi:hypothetical protein
MNERIKLLAEQAKKYALDAMIKITDKEQALKVYSETYDTKFAELIVRECAKVAYKYTDSSVYNDDYDDVGWECLPGDLQTHIKEHFGVKE